MLDLSTYLSNQPSRKPPHCEIHIVVCVLRLGVL
jgi:hypothetical protein